MTGLMRTQERPKRGQFGSLLARILLYLRHNESSHLPIGAEQQVLAHTPATLSVNADHQQHSPAPERSAPLRSASRAEPHRDAAPTALWRPLLPARPAGRCSRLAASERSAAPPATRERSGAARREARRLRTGAARGGPSGSPSPPGVLSAAPASAVAARWRHRPWARTCLMRS